MSHAVYNTEGLILKSINFGEANKYYFILTRDFGLIRVGAQGVRHLKSKLRYDLHDFSLIFISLVRGREVWRLTGVEEKINFKEIYSEDRENFLLISRIFSLLMRLLHGEERNELLFDNLLNGLIFLKTQKLDNRSRSNFECVLALRILFSLGYLGNLADTNNLIESSIWSREIIDQIDDRRRQFIQIINQSLKETHL